MTRIDDHGSTRILVMEGALEVIDLRGLRARRQEGCGIILLSSLQLSRERAQDGDDHQPAGEHEPLGPAPGDHDWSRLTGSSRLPRVAAAEQAVRYHKPVLVACT